MKLQSIFDEVLFDKVIEEDNRENNIKIYYDVDIRITRGSEETEEGETKTEATSYIQKGKGEVTVPERDVQNIQNLHNLVDYTTNLIEGGKPIVNELVAEIVKTAADQGTEALTELVQQDDKIIIDLDYGFDAYDGIGIKLNKTAGSDLVSFSMKKDGNIIPGNFQMNIFEQQILAVRKRFIDKE